jgi:hypothetical protein
LTSGPPIRETDEFLRAAHALNEATPPDGVKRTTNGPLVMLRWIDDPRDERAADAAGVRHEEWVKTLMKTTQL